MCASTSVYGCVVTASTVALDSVVVASKDQMASSIGGETVILGLSAGRYFGLDDVGSRVWQLVQQPVSLRAICDTIVREYDVDLSTCEGDVVRIVGEMLSAGLVEVR